MILNYSCRGHAFVTHPYNMLYILCLSAERVTPRMIPVNIITIVTTCSVAADRWYNIGHITRPTYTSQITGYKSWKLELQIVLLNLKHRHLFFTRVKVALETLCEYVGRRFIGKISASHPYESEWRQTMLDRNHHFMSLDIECTPRMFVKDCVYDLCHM